MEKYSVSWLEIAHDAYISLPVSRRRAVDDRLEQLASQPTADSRQDPVTTWWTTTYGSGTGLLQYGVSRQHRRVVVLRLQDLG